MRGATIGFYKSAGFHRSCVCVCSLVAWSCQRALCGHACVCVCALPLRLSSLISGRVRVQFTCAPSGYISSLAHIGTQTVDANAILPHAFISLAISMCVCVCVPRFACAIRLKLLRTLLTYVMASNRMCSVHISQASMWCACVCLCVHKFPTRFAIRRTCL